MELLMFALAVPVVLFCLVCQSPLPIALLSASLTVLCLEGIARIPRRKPVALGSFCCAMFALLMIEFGRCLDPGTLAEREERTERVKQVLAELEKRHSVEGKP